MWKVRVAAYCLLLNHYHLLIQTPEGNLSRCMRHLDGVYTQRFNRSYHCDGPLFRGRYKSILVDADSYLLELVRYIHRNPLEAAMVEELHKYPWSSHTGYLTRRLRGERLEDIGRGFNISKYSSVSSAIEKIRKEILTNGRMKRRISKVEALLTNSQKQT